jgi:hypothetical protein
MMEILTISDWRYKSILQDCMIENVSLQRHG